MNPLDDHFNRWLEITASCRTQKTALSYRRAYGRFKLWAKGSPVFGKPERLVPENMVKFVNHLALVAGQSPNTVRQRMTSVYRPFFNYLRKRGVISWQPMEGVKLPPWQQTRQISVQRSELERLLDAAKVRADLAKADKKAPYCIELPSAVICSYHTGLRFSDVCHLRWECINLQNRSMLIRPEKRRRVGQVIEIPLADELHGHLAAWRESYRVEADGSYGWWEKTVDYVHPYLALLYDKQRSTLVDALRHLFDLAGLEQGSFHGLRHGFVSRLLNSGVDPITVGSITGQSLKTVERYAHVSLEAKRVALNRAA